MSEKLSDRTARDIAEWYAQNNHPAKSAERKLAKAYLDIVNAEPVAEVSFISTLLEGITVTPLLEKRDENNSKSIVKLLRLLC